MDSTDYSSTRPYLIRALYEWCADNGLTPHLAVRVAQGVQVPQEFVRDGEIVLNIGMDATNALKIGNDYIEFNARFGGVAREIMVPVEQVMAIYARENGQGMSFPVSATKARTPVPAPAVASLVAVDKGVSVAPASADAGEESMPPASPAGGSRPTLTRIK